MKAPANATPRCRQRRCRRPWPLGVRSAVTQPFAEPAHQQHGGKGAEAEGQHDEQPGQSAAAACRLGGEGIDQGTRQEAVEHAEREWRRRPRRAQQVAQRPGQELTPEAKPGRPGKAPEPAEELQADEDHQQAGCDRQDALRAGGGRRIRPARAEPGGEEADQPADEAVGRHAPEIVGQLPPQRGGAASRIRPQRAGKAAAHANAVPASGDPGQEDQRILDHVLTCSHRSRRARAPCSRASAAVGRRVAPPPTSRSPARRPRPRSRRS